MCEAIQKAIDYRETARRFSDAQLLTVFESWIRREMNGTEQYAGYYVSDLIDACRDEIMSRMKGETK